MNERNASLPDQPCEGARVAEGSAPNRYESGGVCELATNHAEGPDDHLDSRLTEVRRKFSVRGENHEWLVARTVQTARDQMQLTVGAVATARGVDEEDRSGADAVPHQVKRPLQD